MKIDIINTIIAINPKALVNVSGNNIDKIEWLEGTTPIDKQIIINKQKELQALEDIYENRRNEYGSIVSQLDEIYHNGIDAWKLRIASVKNKYPKE